MRKIQEASIPTIHPSTHLVTHHIFPLAPHLVPHPSQSTPLEKEVGITIFLIILWYDSELSTHFFI